MTITIPNHGFVAGDETGLMTMRLDSHVLKTSILHTMIILVPQTQSAVSGLRYTMSQPTPLIYSVLNSVPSTNTTAHTFISAVTILITRSAIKKQTGVITFNTNRDAAITHQYAHSFVSASAAVVIAVVIILIPLYRQHLVLLKLRRLCTYICQC